MASACGRTANAWDSRSFRQARYPYGGMGRKRRPRWTHAYGGENAQVQSRDRRTRQGSALARLLDNGWVKGRCRRGASELGRTEIVEATNVAEAIDTVQRSHRIAPLCLLATNITYREFRN